MATGQFKCPVQLRRWFYTACESFGCEVQIKAHACPVLCTTTHLTSYISLH